MGEGVALPAPRCSLQDERGTPGRWRLRSATLESCCHLGVHVRWSALLTFAAASSFAASLLFPRTGAANVDGEVTFACCSTTPAISPCPTKQHFGSPTLMCRYLSWQPRWEVFRRLVAHALAQHFAEALQVACMPYQALPVRPELRRSTSSSRTPPCKYHAIWIAAYMHSSYSWLSSFEWAFLVGRAIGVLGGGSVFAEALFRRTAELSLLWELPMGLWQMSGIARCPVAVKRNVSSTYLR